MWLSQCKLIWEKIILSLLCFDGGKIHGNRLERLLRDWSVVRPGWKAAGAVYQYQDQITSLVKKEILLNSTATSKY